jgi:uncharacterized RDD family membrane protein YckC
MPGLAADASTLNADPAAPPMVAPGLGRRMACWLYEGMLLYAVLFVGGYLFSSLSQTRHALDNRHAQQAFLFVLLGIYFVWFWARGQTLAMKTWHIRLVDRAGRPVSQARAAARYLLSWLWFLPAVAASSLAELPVATALVLSLLWILAWALASRLHPERQFPHDVLAGTRLISSSSGS